MSNGQEKAESEFKITTNWVNRSSRLKIRYPALNDDDLKFNPGDEKQLVARVAARLNKTADEVIRIIKHTY